jgi:hypothetical protein
MFLRGAAGALLALPTLPSLLSEKEALAQAQGLKFFVHMRTPHGGVGTTDMWPTAASALTDTFQYTHAIRRGTLSAPVSGGKAVISNVLAASSNVLTPSVLAKMNVLRGLDIPTGMAHNFGGALGYYDVNHQTPAQPRATIDQIMAYSPEFYPSISTVRERSVAMGLGQTGSWGYNTPGVRSSGVSASGVGGVQSSQELFDTLLGGVASSPPGRPPVVDQVLASYNRLRNGNKRLSSEDKQRLDQHIAAVSDLQRRLGTSLSAGCKVPPRPTSDNLSLLPMDGNPTKNVQFFTMVNQIIAIAMSCGSTRIFTSTIDEDNQGCTFTTRPAQGEDWHNNVAHAATSQTAAMSLIAQFNQVFFSGVYMDLVSQLDSFSDGVGGTLLDHALVVWGQECGTVTHMPFSMPVITAGSAGGAIKTGNYCDYRNLGRQLSGDSTTGTESNSLYSGLIYNQWLTTALLAMGVPQAEWAETTHPGYGARVSYAGQPDYFFTNQGFKDTDCYTDAMWQKTGEILPFLNPAA